ncbi:hypothetical protein PU560_01895, partial [Georgenia sp. 10Sc9-8]|nr:hypothetical protein [Georgenia halotolerans]
MDRPGTPRTGWLAAVGAAAADALGLVLPVECAGCGRWDQALCQACRNLLRAPLRRCEDDAPALTGLPTWCLGAYTGPLRAIVLAWKNHRRTDISGAVLHGARRAGRAWAAELVAEALRDDPRGGPGRPGTEMTGALVVVPAPSGWRRRLTRRLVVGDLA